MIFTVSKVGDQLGGFKVTENIRQLQSTPLMTLNSESHRVVKGGRLPAWVKLEEISSSDHSWLGPGPLLHILSTWVTIKGICALSQARPSVLSKRMYLVHLPLFPNDSHKVLFIRRH